MTQTFNTIVLKGRGITKEGTAAAAVSPGDLVQFTSTGGLERHATGGGVASRLIAKEWEYYGYDLTQDYAAGDYVTAEDCYPGMEVYATIAAGAAAITEGALLESAGDGTLRNQTPSSQLAAAPYTYTPAGHPIAIARDSVDNSAGASKVRLWVELL